jgi:hypothetical protein
MDPNAATNLGNVRVDCAGRRIELEFTMARNDTGWNKLFYSGYATNDARGWRIYSKAFTTSKNTATLRGVSVIGLTGLDLGLPIRFLIESYRTADDAKNGANKIASSAEIIFDFLPPPANLRILRKIGARLDIKWDPVATADKYIVSYDTDPPSGPKKFNVMPPATEATLSSLDNDKKYTIVVSASNSRCRLTSLNSNSINVETSLERCVRIQDKMDVEMNRRRYHLDTAKSFHLLQRLFMKIRDYYLNREGGDEARAFAAVKEYFLHPVSLKPGGGILATLHFRLINILFKNPTVKYDKSGAQRPSETQLFLNTYFPGMSNAGAEEQLRENYFRLGYPGGDVEFEKLKRVLLFEYQLELETQLRFVLRGNAPQLSGKASDEFAYIFLYNKPPDSERKDDILLHLSIADPLTWHKFYNYHLTDKCYGPRSVAKAGGSMTTGGIHMYYKFLNDTPSTDHKSSPLAAPYVIQKDGRLVYSVTGNTLYANGTRWYNKRHFTDPKIAPQIDAANLAAAKLAGYRVASPFKEISLATLDGFKDIPIQYILPDKQLDLEGNIIYKADNTILTPDFTRIYPTGISEYADGSVGYPDGKVVYPDGRVGYPDGRVEYPDGSVGYPDGSVVYPDGRVEYPDGRVEYPDGRVEYPDGSVGYPDGSVGYPDGSVGYPDGRVVYSDGKVVYPDGKIKFADGTRRYVNATGKQFVDVIRNSTGRVSEVWSPQGGKDWIINYPQRGVSFQQVYNAGTNRTELRPLPAATRRGRDRLFASRILHKSNGKLSLPDRTVLNISNISWGGSKKTRRVVRRKSNKKTTRKQG